MAVLGPRNLLDLAIPVGIDGAEVLRFQMQDGATAQEAISMASTTIGAVNEALVMKYGKVLFITEEMFARARQGSATRRMTPRHSEFVPPDPIKGQEIGHMWPMFDFTDALAWTEHYLRRAHMEKLEVDIQEIADSWTNRVEYDILTRMLTNSENAIGTNSAAWDAPWAIGTGTNLDYIPPQFGATVFTSSHSHFLVLDDDTYAWSDMFDGVAATGFVGAVEHLRHHGISGTISAFFSRSDVKEVKALSKFVRLEPTGTVQIVSGNSGAPIRIARGEDQGMPGELFGYYDSDYGLIELYFNDRLPANYAFFTRSYGSNNMNNGLVLREEPGIGFGLRVDPQMSRSLQPKLETIAFHGTHGCGVNKRLNGVACFLASAASNWVNPEIA